MRQHAHVAVWSRAFPIPVPCHGADLTVRLFKDGIPNGTRVALIVGTEKVAADVRAAYPGIDFRVHVPPMGLLSNLEAQQECMDFAVRSEARFIFLAVGAPNPKSSRRNSPNPQPPGEPPFALEPRSSFSSAPRSGRRYGCGNSALRLDRMISDPKRLWRRYVYGIAPLLALFARDLLSARRPSAHRNADSATIWPWVSQTTPDRESFCRNGGIQSRKSAII